MPRRGPDVKRPQTKGEAPEVGVSALHSGCDGAFQMGRSRGGPGRLAGEATLNDTWLRVRTRKAVRYRELPGTNMVLR